MCIKKRNSITAERREVHTTGAKQNIERQQILQTGEINNDTIRTDVIERIRREQREHKANSRRQQQTGGELLSSFERERESKQGVIKTISDYARELKQVAEKVINKAKGMFRNN